MIKIGEAVPFFGKELMDFVWFLVPEVTDPFFLLV